MTPGKMEIPVQTGPNARAPGRRSTFRDVTRTQWNAFFAAFLGWALDAFDFSILSFLLIDIEHTFTVDKALASALGTVTLMFRLVGGLSAGTAADRFDRKFPLILSILWLSLFSLLSGFSTSDAMLFGVRALFGIGMGGVWAAGMPLALEHWPDHLRGVASGLLAGGFYWGYMLAAVVFQVLYPLVSEPNGPGWRMFFWLGGAPALLPLWIALHVKESPVWLARRSYLRDSNQRDGLSIRRIFRRDLVATTLQTSLLIGVFMMSYYFDQFLASELSPRSQTADDSVPGAPESRWNPGSRALGARFRDSRRTKGSRDAGRPHRSARDPDLRRTALSHRVVTWRAADGRLWHGSLWYCAVLSDRTVSDRCSQCGARVCLPRRRGPWISNAGIYRCTSGSRDETPQRHGRLHPRFRRIARRHDLAGPGDAGSTLHAIGLKPTAVDTGEL
jgi:MFS family permease